MDEDEDDNEEDEDANSTPEPTEALSSVQKSPNAGVESDSSIEVSQDPGPDNHASSLRAASPMETSDSVDIRGADNNDNAATGDPVSSQTGSHDAPNGISTAPSDVAESTSRPDTTLLDDPTPMELESSSSSPDNTTAMDDNLHHISPVEAPLPDQISSVVKPREQVQETESEIVREVIDTAATMSKSTFKPYESPLRYFRAYRFHSGYKDSVAGGLKSLTYSNKIDPKKPFCPYELTSEPCPESCEFQHLNSVNAPDDQILLELGKADEYGDQKNRFIQGLREVLHDFRTKKVKDFDTIARGIIEFRSRFLQDDSKVLHLEGVTL